MLSFDDKRWNDLSTTYEVGDCLGSIVREWFESIGFDQERSLYNAVSDQFTHQSTVSDCAYAIVPYMVAACDERKSRLIEEYLVDIGLVEMARLNSMFPGPEIPGFLAHEYHRSVEQCQNISEDFIDGEEDSDSMHELHAVQPIFFGNASLAFERWKKI